MPNGVGKPLNNTQSTLVEKPPFGKFLDPANKPVIHQKTTTIIKTVKPPELNTQSNNGPLTLVDIETKPS